MPRRHVTALPDLTDTEAERLGTWQVRLSRALHTVTGCGKTYLAQFAEAEGFAHVHVHVIPRAADLPVDLRGPRVFEHLRRPEAEHITAARIDALAEHLRRALTMAT